MSGEIMVFVGTEYPAGDGPQFHVWVDGDGTTEDLAEAIGVHHSLRPTEFILQHLAFPLVPSTSLAAQRIGPYSTVHMYLLADLRARDAQRKEEAKREADTRGRYITKDGTDRLRRRTRAALAAVKAKRELESRGYGVVPRYAELERVSKEFPKHPRGAIEWDRGSGSAMALSKQGKGLLTRTPLEMEHRAGPSNWSTRSAQSHSRSDSHAYSQSLSPAKSTSSSSSMTMLPRPATSPPNLRDPGRRSIGHPQLQLQHHTDQWVRKHGSPDPCRDARLEVTLPATATSTPVGAESTTAYEPDQTTKSNWILTSTSVPASTSGLSAHTDAEPAPPTTSAYAHVIPRRERTPPLPQFPHQWCSSPTSCTSRSGTSVASSTDPGFRGERTGDRSSRKGF